MSKLLRRALKISLVPAICMIAGKFFGIMIVSLAYDLEFFIENNTGSFSSIQIAFSDNSTTLFVNSMSNLTMVLILAIPTLYLIIKTSIYQSTLQNPKTIVKITRLNILKWITKKDTSFLQIFIWCIFLVIASALTIVHTIQENTYSWVGILSGVLSFLSIWGTIKTFEMETDKIYPREHRYY